MRYPTVRHVVTCLPCGWREATRPGNAYAVRCPDCGGKLEHYVATVDRPSELRDINRDGARILVERPRLVIGGPA